ncbi:MAG TPA: response regulator transcription factor [Candidatus Limnocylindrales bacterium]
MSLEHRPIRVAIVDDHPVVRDGIVALLREYPGIEIAGTAASLDLAEPLLDPAHVDVLLLDIRLGQETGFQLLERHRDLARRPAIVVLTAFAQAEYAAAAHRLGAAALVVKTAPMPELVAAIRAAAVGESVDAVDARAATDPTLTTREQEIVRLVVVGCSNDEIGAGLSIATKTVEGHLRRIFERLGIESRAALSARAVAEGWLDVPTVARRRGSGPKARGEAGRGVARDQ